MTLKKHERNKLKGLFRRLGYLSDEAQEILVIQITQKLSPEERKQYDAEYEKVCYKRYLVSQEIVKTLDKKASTVI